MCVSVPAAEHLETALCPQTDPDSLIRGGAPAGPLQDAYVNRVIMLFRSIDARSPGAARLRSGAAGVMGYICTTLWRRRPVGPGSDLSSRRAMVAFSPRRPVRRSRLTASPKPHGCHQTLS